jgi:hypothetical protein
MSTFSAARWTLAQGLGVILPLTHGADAFAPVSHTYCSDRLKDVHKAVKVLQTVMNSLTIKAIAISLSSS